MPPSSSSKSSSSNVIGRCLLTSLALSMLYVTYPAVQWMDATKDLSKENNPAIFIALSGHGISAHSSQPLPPPPADDKKNAYDAFNTPAVQCRLGMEKFQNDNIDYWMTHAPFPLVEWIWEETDAQTGRPYYFGFFNVLRKEGWAEDRAKEIVSWQWTWQDHEGNHYDIEPDNIWMSSQYWTRVYFRLDPAKSLLKKRGSKTVPKQHRPKYLWPTLPTDDAQYAEVKKPVYDLEPYIECNQIEKANPPHALQTTSSKKKTKQPKVAACVTRFWDQYDLMPEWIAYHRLIGVEHFFFYVGEQFSNLYNATANLRHEEDITFVPYNYNWNDHKHNVQKEQDIAWDSEDYFQETWFQVSENNQCLHQAKQYGFDFVYTPDLDEYIVITDPAIQHFGDVPPLQQYLSNNHDPAKNSDVGEVCLFGAGFGRHPDKEPLDSSRFELTIDFIYRTDRQYGNFKTISDGKGWGGRRKCLYNTHVVTGVTIHFKDFDTPGETAYAMEDQVELYHYRSPLLGSEVKWNDGLVAYPEFRNQYRKAIADALHAKNWQYPNLHAHTDAGYGSLEVREQ